MKYPLSLHTKKNYRKKNLFDIKEYYKNKQKAK